MLFSRTNNTIHEVSVNQVNTAMQGSGVLLVDVREPYEYEAGHAERAVNIPLSSLSKETIEKLKQYTDVYVICQSGGRSVQAVSILKSYGVNAINVMGGTSAWQAQGLSIVKS